MCRPSGARTETIFNILTPLHAEKIDNANAALELNRVVADRNVCPTQTQLAELPTAVVYTADSRGLGEKEFEAVKCPTEEAFALSK